MSRNNQPNFTIISPITPLFRIAYITQSLIQLRRELEAIAPLDQKAIPADELLFSVCNALDLPVEAVNQILGTAYQPQS